MSRRNSGDDSIEFSLKCAVDHIGAIFPNHGTIRWNFHHIHVVNFCEFNFLRSGSTSHTGEFFIHTEVILKSNGSQGLTFPFNFYAFLRFQGLM